MFESFETFFWHFFDCSVMYISIVNFMFLWWTLFFEKSCMKSITKKLIKSDNFEFWTLFPFLDDSALVHHSAKWESTMSVCSTTELTTAAAAWQSRPLSWLNRHRSTWKRAPIDCARAKQTAIHWLIFQPKKLSHLWDWRTIRKKFVC